MSCLRDSICQIDPSLQELVRAIENASTLPLLILSEWRLARAFFPRVLRHGETNIALNDISSALILDALPETGRKALKNSVSISGYTPIPHCITYLEWSCRNSQSVWKDVLPRCISGSIRVDQREYVQAREHLTACQI